MPNIRDLGISSIPATARPMTASDGDESGYNQTTSPPLCGCEPTSRPGCNPTYQEPECQPTSQPGCNPTNNPVCEPTSQPGCNPTNEPAAPSTCDPTSQPGCNPTNQARGQGHGAYSAIPPEAIAQLKQQLKHHISTEIRN